MSHLPHGPVHNEHVRDSQGTTCTSCRGSIQAEVIADVLSAHDCSSLTAMQFRRVDYTEVSIQAEVIAAVLRTTVVVSRPCNLRRVDYTEVTRTRISLSSLTAIPFGRVDYTVVSLPRSLNPGWGDRICPTHIEDIPRASSLYLSINLLFHVTVLFDRYFLCYQGRQSKTG